MDPSSPSPPDGHVEAKQRQRKLQEGLARRRSSNQAFAHILRKYWPTALVATILVLLGVTFFTLGQKKIYQASATIQFDPNPPRPLGRRVEQVVDMGMNSYWSNQEYYETQYRVIRSMRVAQAVVRELGLHNDPAFLENTPKGEKPRDPKQRVAPEIAAQTLRRRLRVEPVKDSRLTMVHLKDANPERAQRVLGRLVETYREQNLEQALASTTSATDWLRGQLDKLKVDLESSELDLHHYKKDKDILSVAFDDQTNILREEISYLNKELTRVRTTQQHAIARQQVLSTVPDDDATIVTSTELLQSSRLAALRLMLDEAKRDRDALKGEGMAEAHPKVIAAQAKVDVAEKAVLKEIKNIKRAVSRESAVYAREAGGIASMLKASKAKAHELNLLEIEFKRLQRQKENTEKLYALVLERTKEADLAAMLRINNISILDPPLKPIDPILPRVPLNIAAGLIAGLLLGIAAAFTRGFFDRTLKVPDDIEVDFGVTFLGLLPELSERTTQGAGYARKRGRRKRLDKSRPELIVHDAPASSVAEAARAIRTNLMFMAPDRPYKTLLVTSAGPSEGKTTVACCVAIAMAQAGQRVVLIDCDLRRPRVHRIFRVPSDEGVTGGLLTPDLDLDVHETEVPNLSALAAGPVPPNPAEIFHSEKFRQLLAKLQTQYDRVVIDSPPVAAVTDATILSTLADGVVVVARAYATRKELARHALRSVVDVGGELAGVVLNAVNFSRLEYKYSYYYYRREGYERDEDDESFDHDDAPPPESRASA